MREFVRFNAAALLPPADVVLHGLGLPEGPARLGPTRVLLDSAMIMCGELAEPRGVFEGIGAEEFADVYRGEGKNAAETPLAIIVPRAEGLALFAATLVFTIIILFDAQGVRRWSGRQGQVLNKMMEDIYFKRRIQEERLKELLGHTPTEVLAGMGVGFLTAMAVR